MERPTTSRAVDRKKKFQIRTRYLRDEITKNVDALVTTLMKTIWTMRKKQFIIFSISHYLHTNQSFVINTLRIDQASHSLSLLLNIPTTGHSPDESSIDQTSHSPSLNILTTGHSPPLSNRRLEIRNSSLQPSSKYERKEGQEMVR